MQVHWSSSSRVLAHVNPFREIRNHTKPPLEGNQGDNGFVPEHMHLGSTGRVKNCWAQTISLTSPNRSTRNLAAPLPKTRLWGGGGGHRSACHPKCRGKHTFSSRRPNSPSTIDVLTSQRITNSQSISNQNKLQAFITDTPNLSNLSRLGVPCLIHRRNPRSRPERRDLNLSRPATSHTINPVPSQSSRRQKATQNKAPSGPTQTGPIPLTSNIGFSPSSTRPGKTASQSCPSRGPCSRQGILVGSTLKTLAMIQG